MDLDRVGTAKYVLLRYVGQSLWPCGMARWRMAGTYKGVVERDTDLPYILVAPPFRDFADNVPTRYHARLCLFEDIYGNTLHQSEEAAAALANTNTATNGPHPLCTSRLLTSEGPATWLCT